MERLVATLSPSGDELTLELLAGETTHTDRIAPGITLERGADRVPRRLRLTGLRGPWLTNIFVSPAIACTLDGCTQLARPDGVLVYLLGIGGPAKEHPIYFDESRRRGDPETRPDSGRAGPD
jgi:hypothetical protein